MDGAGEGWVGRRRRRRITHAPAPAGPGHSGCAADPVDDRADESVVRLWLRVFQADILCCLVVVCVFSAGQRLLGCREERGRAGLWVLICYFFRAKQFCGKTFGSCGGGVETPPSCWMSACWGQDGFVEGAVAEKKLRCAKAASEPWVWNHTHAFPTSGEGLYMHTASNQNVVEGETTWYVR